MEIIMYILIFQGILGGFDVIWNHEYKESLPSKPSAALEQKIHGIRELFYAIIFLGLAWYSWHGFWAWVMAGILLIEIILTAWDFVTEDQTRQLSPTERITHLILSMTGGAYVALLIPILWQWSNEVSSLQSANYGFLSIVVSVFGIGVFGWAVRDLKSGFQLSQVHLGDV
ncbi:hypothetical protein PN36_29625 [Candidatus Thiomargarita nelsonii]|uniref:Uncharacterized protein n=1 Tax=Candidatus Thiomargarita nelsonii TaxID=1003181 RepID=A0A0A6PCJ2_9GAMM|nr:hypothetical protein PN36_29625 [Candidatus Thiomargarita nelsonii]